MASYIAFILSTGRCGTQWVAQSLGDTYSNFLDVSHEPLHDTYDPRRMLGVSTGATDELPDAVVVHAEELARRDRPYLECGHPCWSSIPFLMRRFPQRTRVVHLVRHPVPTCLSWLTHSAYEAPWLPHLEEKVLLSPYDAGTRFFEYRDRWEELSPFEKCVYYWTEVNALALETGRQVKTPWLRLAYEDLFWGDGLEDLLAFLDLPARPDIFETRSELLDNYRYLTPPGHDWRSINRHPHAVETAKKLGYDVLAVDEDSMLRRYVHGQ
jgi:hypothetical protein